MSSATSTFLEPYHSGSSGKWQLGVEPTELDAEGGQFWGDPIEVFADVNFFVGTSTSGDTGLDLTDTLEGCYKKGAGNEDG